VPKLKLISKIAGYVVTALLAVMLLSNVYTIIARAVTGEAQPKFLGFSSAIVISGSMSDTIEVNDYIICLDVKDYDEGDIITFKSERGSLITHRIVGETESGFITQGDANNTPDSEPVSKSDIVGKVVIILPKLGVFIEFMQSPMGLMCIVFAGFLILCLPSLADRCNQRKNEIGEAPMNGGNNDESGNKDSQK